MPLLDPQIPYQDNSWDCGVFVCRYALSMLQLKDEIFTSTDIKNAAKKLKEDIATSKAFDFGMDDIRSLRSEMRSLLEQLVQVYKGTITEKSGEKNLKVGHDTSNTSEYEATREVSIKTGDDLGHENASSEKTADTDCKQQLHKPSCNGDTHAENKSQIGEDSSGGVEGSPVIEGQSSQNPDMVESFNQLETCQDRIATNGSTQEERATKDEEDVSLGMKADVTKSCPHSKTDTYTV